MHPVNHRRRGWRLIRLVLGEVVAVHIDESLLGGRDLPDRRGSGRFCARAVPAPITPLMKACAFDLVRPDAR